MPEVAPRSTPRDLPHITGRLFDTPLAMDSRKLDSIVPAFLNRLNNAQDAMLFAEDERTPEESCLDANGIWTISIIGSLVRRSSYLDAWSGLTSYGAIRDSMRKASNDARVKGILLRIDSYGGEAAGLFELCDDLYPMRQNKPIWAVCDVDALSAAYALATCANKIVIAPSGMAGSIGVVAVHLERSQMNEALGLTYTVFRAGERKADFNPYEQLAPEAASRLQASMDRNRDVFVRTVVRNRPNLTVDAVMATEGAWYDADEALRLGLVDQLATFEAAYQQFVDGIGNGTVVPIPPPEPTAPIEPDEVDQGERTMTTKPETTENKPAGETTAAAAPPASEAVAAPPAPPSTNNVVNMPQTGLNADDLILVAELCNMTGFPEKTSEFQRGLQAGTMTMKGIREQLTNLRAAKDQSAATSNLQSGKEAGSGGMFGLSAGGPTPEILNGWDKAFDRAVGKA